MSGDFEHPGLCAAFADDLTELALATLAEPRRSQVLDHVESCQRCRAELEQLAIVVETVQQLAPRVQPPLGFETRVAAKLKAMAKPRPRRRRVAVFASVAAAVVLLAFGLGTLVAPKAGDDKSQSSAQPVARASFMSDGKVIGDAFVAQGSSPPLMFIAIHQEEGGWQGTVTCNVTMSSGEVETVGVFKLSGEYGAWVAPLPSYGGMVRSAQLVASNGMVVANAELMHDPSTGV